MGTLLKQTISKSPTEKESESTSETEPQEEMPKIVDSPTETKGSVHALAEKLNKELTLEKLNPRERPALPEKPPKAEKPANLVLPIQKPVEEIEKSTESPEKVRTPPTPTPRKSIGESSPKTPEAAPRTKIRHTSSVKQMQAILNIPMKTPSGPNGFLKSPSKVPVLPMPDKNLDDKSKENIENSEQGNDFTFEKQKITLRQRTKNTKRPVSKKFRNSMQINANSVLDDIP